MAIGIEGSYIGVAHANVNLVPIMKENEVSKIPNSFLKFAPLVIKKIAIAADAGTRFKINNTEFLMPSQDFELGYGLIDITNLIFLSDTNVTIVYVY